MIQVVQVCDLIVILLGCIMVVTIPVSHSLRFELQSGHSKCIFEEIKGDSMSVGKYSIANPNEEAHNPLPNTYNVSVRTASTLGVEYHTAEQVQSGQFAFTAVEGGDYMTCFRAPEHHTTPTTLTIEFEWKTGIAAMDWSTVAKKGQVDVMELELKKLQDRISSIHDEMFYLREREEEMQELNESTNTKMALLSFLSLFVCLSVAGLQLWHLKTFFQKKKII